MGICAGFLFVSGYSHSREMFRAKKGSIYLMGVLCHKQRKAALTAYSDFLGLLLLRVDVDEKRNAMANSLLSNVVQKRNGPSESVAKERRLDREGL